MSPRLASSLSFTTPQRGAPAGLRFGQVTFVDTRLGEQERMRAPESNGLGAAGVWAALLYVWPSLSGLFLHVQNGGFPVL